MHDREPFQHVREKYVRDGFHSHCETLRAHPSNTGPPQWHQNQSPAPIQRYQVMNLDQFIKSWRTELARLGVDINRITDSTDDDTEYWTLFDFEAEKSLLWDKRMLTGYFMKMKTPRQIGLLPQSENESTSNNESHHNHKTLRRRTFLFHCRTLCLFLLEKLEVCIILSFSWEEGHWHNLNTFVRLGAQTGVRSDQRDVSGQGFPQPLSSKPIPDSYYPNNTIPARYWISRLIRLGYHSPNNAQNTLFWNWRHSFWVSHNLSLHYFEKRGLQRFASRPDGSGVEQTGAGSLSVAPPR